MQTLALCAKDVWKGHDCQIVVGEWELSFAAAASAAAKMFHWLGFGGVLLELCLPDSDIEELIELIPMVITT